MAIKKRAVTEEVMKAVLALIVIYVGTFLVAIQGASNTSVEASEQTSSQENGSIDPAKEKDIRSLMKLTGARETIQATASAAADQYRQKVVATATNSDRAQVFTNAYLADFQKQFDADAVSGQLVGIYGQHFTEDEIKQLVEFYNSPLGQKLAAEMPKISRESQRTAEVASSQAARLAWQDLRAEYPSAGETVRGAVTQRRAGVSTHAEAIGVQQASADSQ
jgi:hypothetical protein